MALQFVPTLMGMTAFLVNSSFICPTTVQTEKGTQRKTNQVEQVQNKQ